MKTSDDFIYWLSGALEFVNPEEMTTEQMKTILFGIQDHLTLVVDKVTPDRINKSPSYQHFSTKQVDIKKDLPPPIIWPSRLSPENYNIRDSYPFVDGPVC